MDEWLDGPFSIAPKRNLHSSSSGTNPINVISPPGNFFPQQDIVDLVDENSRTEVGRVSSGGPFSAPYYSSMYGGSGIKTGNNNNNNNSSSSSAQKNPFSASSSSFKSPFPMHNNMAGPFSSFSESKRLSGGSNLFGSSSSIGNVTGSGSSNRNIFESSSSSMGHSNSGIRESDHTASSAFKSAGTVHHQALDGPFSSSEGKSRGSGQPAQLAGGDSFSVFRCRDSSPYTERPFSTSAVTPYEKQSNCIDLSGDNIRLTPNNSEISVEMLRLRTISIYYS